MGVVVLSQYTEADYVMRLFESGSDRRAYLLKENIHNRAELVRAITSVAAGDAAIDAKMIEVLVAAAPATRHPRSQSSPHASSTCSRCSRRARATRRSRPTWS